MNNIVWIEKIDWKSISIFLKKNGLIQGSFGASLSLFLLSVFLSVTHSFDRIFYFMQSCFLYLSFHLFYRYWIDFTFVQKLSHFSYKLLLFVILTVQSIKSSPISVLKCFSEEKHKLFLFLLKCQEKDVLQNPFDASSLEKSNSVMWTDQI